jgi:uncharacterized protein (TIGR02118 family)
MIKVLALLTRQPELTHAQFVKHWLEVHGPLAHAVPGVRRYVQSHIVGTRTRPDIPETDVEVDGIAELWYDDEAAMQRAVASPEMKRLTDDGALIIGRIKTYIIDEKQIIPRGSTGRTTAPSGGVALVTDPNGNTATLAIDPRQDLVEAGWPLVDTRRTAPEVLSSVA